MSERTLENFRVSPGSLAAYDAAVKVACLRWPAGTPLVFHGEAGSGKTHLLEGILSHLQAAFPQTGLVYLPCGALPESARALVRDPSPLERVQSAVLVVDALEKPGAASDELAELACHFETRGHLVVSATACSLAELNGLPSFLLALLKRAQWVDIECPQRDIYDLEIDTLRQRVVELEAELERERDVRDRLLKDMPERFAAHADAEHRPREMDAEAEQNPAAEAQHEMGATATSGFMRVFRKRLQPPDQTLPQQETPKVLVRCACGATARVAAGAVGRMGKCPKCAALIPLNEKTGTPLATS